MIAALITLGALIILALSGVAIHLWRKVWAAERRQREGTQQQLNHEARMEHIHDSLQLLANSVLNDQVRIAEAGIRMAILLDNLNLSCEEKHRLSPITEVYNRTRHIPTHERLNSLAKNERKKYQKEVRLIEEELAHAVKEAARHITDPDFKHKRTLH